MNESAEHSCELCHAKFYFEKDANNPFYIAHMNSHHKNEIPGEWIKCSNCGLNVPNMKLHTERNCIMKLVTKNASADTILPSYNSDMVLLEPKKRTLLISSFKR